MLKPFENHILILCIKDPEKTTGGLWIPDVAKGKERPRRGVIVRVGPGAKRGPNGTRITMELAGCEGMTVIYDEFSICKEAGDLIIEDKKHVLVNEDGVIGILDDNGVALEPTHDRVLVRPAEQTTVTAGGIVIPDVAKEKPLTGQVVAAGPGKRDDRDVLVPLDVGPEDTVLFGKYSGTKLRLGEAELVLLREEDIYAKLDGE